MWKFVEKLIGNDAANEPKVESPHRTKVQPPRRGYRKRVYAGAQSDRFTSGFGVTNTTSDTELRDNLPALRARCRILERDEPLAVKFLDQLEQNVIGPEGIFFQNQAMLDADTPDDKTNDLIETHFRRWAESMNCSADGQSMWPELLRQFIRTTGCDGEHITQPIRGFKHARNPYGYALMFIEADQLDERMNGRLKGGNTVKLGVEKNEVGRPIAYHLHDAHPGDTLYTAIYKPHVRVRAEDLYHRFVKQRATQSRGVPWMHAAIISLRHRGKFREASLIASRLGASKMGFFTSDDGTEYTGDDIETEGGTDEAEVDADGNTGNEPSVITEAEAGMFEQLPEGVDFKEWNPQYPQNEFDPFMKAITQEIAVSVGMSYVSLSGDLKGVTFSSVRAGTLSERDTWRILQRWVIRYFCAPIVREWLMMAIMAGQLPFKLTDIDRILQPEWNVRGWDWVDPLKDIAATKVALELGLTSASIELAKHGSTLERVLKSRKRDDAMYKKYGVVPSFDTNAESLLAAVAGNPKGNDDE